MSWPAFQVICDLLHANRPQHVIGVPWEDVIGVAARQMVVPTFVGQLAAVPDIPSDVLDYFTACHALNSERNERVIQVVCGVATQLEDSGLRPVFLKGAASLATRLYDDLGQRVVGDVDVLVPARDVATASANLEAAGYWKFGSATKRWIKPAAHHAPTLVAPSHAVGVELHWRLTPRSGDTLVPAGWFREQACVTRLRGVPLRVPSATARIVHNIVHDQLHHEHYRRGTTELRQLYELARLASAHNGQIDWPEIVRIFARSGRSIVLHKQVALCRELLGAEIPVAVGRPTAFVDRLADAIEAAGRPRSGLALAWQIYADAFADNPLLVLNLFDPRSWPGRTRTIRELFDRRTRDRTG